LLGGLLNASLNAVGEMTEKGEGVTKDVAAAAAI
jgi:hypothetical protein